MSIRNRRSQGLFWLFRADSLHKSVKIFLVHSRREADYKVCQFQKAPDECSLALWLSTCSCSDEFLPPSHFHVALWFRISLSNLNFYSHFIISWTVKYCITRNSREEQTILDLGLFSITLSLVEHVKFQTKGKVNITLSLFILKTSQKNWRNLLLFDFRLNFANAYLFWFVSRKKIDDERSCWMALRSFETLTYGVVKTKLQLPSR